MSWSLYAKGTKEDIQKQLDAATIYDSFPQVEQDQEKMAFELIKHTIDSIELPENKVFNVEAFGSCGQSDGKVTDNTVSVKVQTVVKAD